MRTQIARMTLLCLASTAPAASGAAWAQDEIQYMGKAYLFQADIERARSAGWIDAMAGEDEILDGIRETLDRRVRSMGMFPEARAEREENGQFAVIFVGRMAQPMETFLQRGLSNPGHISYYAVARQEDLGGDSDLKAERRRLDRWAAEHPEQPLAHFNDIPKEQGGPHPAILWLPQSPRTTASSPDGTPQKINSEPLALLRDSAHEFLRTHMGEKGLGMAAESPEDKQLGVVFNLLPEHADELRAFGERHRGRRQAFVVNDRVVELRDVPEAFENPVHVEAGLSVEEYRELLLAVSGGPLQAPLTFVGFGKRPLLGVKTGADDEKPPAGPDQKPNHKNGE